jgi:PIN domain nuclease of toxin-antitoxin system
VDVGLAGRRGPVPGAPTVILLDTNAVIWMDQNHPRTRTLARALRLLVSPATILELQLLQEIGRLRLRSGTRGVIDSDAWLVDEPPAVDWFERAAEESWTRDPFDRLIVAHARLRHYRLATGDKTLLEHLRPSERVEL